MNQGWIKLHRQMLQNPVVMKDSDHLALWVLLLLKATHNGIEVCFHGRRIKLQPGEITTGRKVLAGELRVSESKVQRMLKEFESEQQIEQRTDRQCRYIKVLNWDKYQQSEQRTEQQMNNERTTTEQRLNTKQECKNEINKITPVPPKGVVSDSFEKFWSAYPKKVGKQAAIKAFKRAVKFISVDSMLEAIDKQKTSDQWKRDNGKYIPNPTTWLNQGRWDDNLNNVDLERPKREIKPIHECPNCKSKNIKALLDYGLCFDCNLGFEWSWKEDNWITVR